MRFIGISLGGVSLLLGALMCGACSAPRQPVVFEHYQPAYRQHPPEPVYSRVSWSHLPEPVRPKPTDSAPLFQPNLSFELPESTFGEAVEVLAQTIGYRWHYPGRIASRPISVKMAGSVEEILAELSSQAGVRAMLDHDARIVRVVDERMTPQLPGQ